MKITFSSSLPIAAGVLSLGCLLATKTARAQAPDPAPEAAALAVDPSTTIPMSPGSPGDIASRSKGTYAVSTYECLGLYHKSPDVGECKVRFRAQGAAQWRDGLPLWYDARMGEYRGSLVYLQPDTPYIIELMLGGKAVTVPGARTRSDKFPIGKTTTIKGGESYDPIIITESGTPDAYHLVTVPPGERVSIDVANGADNTVTVDADYVIVRGLELKNARKHGLYIGKGHHDIVVEDCHILGWGNVGGSLSFGNEGARNSGIFADLSTANLTLQYNLIEDPRGGSNDWRTGHPQGPDGITTDQSQGGNVLRYNTIRSGEDHGYDDGITGAYNGSRVGSMHRDSDIYGNYVRNVWDDALEVEGGNRNVRIWGNYLHMTTQGIALASTADGPVYVFRNVMGRSRWTHEEGSGGGYAIKTGDYQKQTPGRRFMFHNTVLQPGGEANAFSGHSPDPNVMSRNNVWDVGGQLNRNRAADTAPLSSFAYDIFTGIRMNMPTIENEVRTNPTYIPAEGLEFYPQTWYLGVEGGRSELTRAGRTFGVSGAVLTRRNKMMDGGTPIPNFNDGFVGKAPDVGAFERGLPPLKFGREGAGRPFAPWQ